MSVSLIKKSLELVSTDRTQTAERKLNSESNPNRNRKTITKRRSVVDDRQKESVIRVQKVRQKSNRDRDCNLVETNIQKLLKLSRTNVINNKKLEKKLIQKISKTKEECAENKDNQKTAFTEEDFAKFEKEYFVN